jgi:outer membrane immunogenic protein
MGASRFSTISIAIVALASPPIAANAADAIPAPIYQPAPTMPLAYSWSGLSIGGHVGAGWLGGDGTGFLGGGQAGYNYQIGQWVFGAEGQVSATSIKETVSASLVVPGFAFGTANAEATLDWVSTFAARAGWAVDRWLVYGKVGGAWAHATAKASATINTIVGGASVAASASNTSGGWMLGLGTEYALRDNWTAKIEYDMLDFGNDFTANGNVHVVKAGVNYHFGFGSNN